jgi:hypothetical protein
MLPEVEPSHQFRSMIMKPQSLSASSSRTSSPHVSMPMPMRMGMGMSSMPVKPVAKRPNTAMKQPSNPTITNWTVPDANVRNVPSFYPLEKSSRFIQDSPANIASRISDCCRLLSVQAVFNDDLATADLTTEDHVDIHLTLWRGDSEVPAPNNDGSGVAGAASAGLQDANAAPPVNITIVEAQRRKGCAVVYHRYCRNILDAAQGCFTADDASCKPRQEQYPRVEALRKEKEAVEGENSLLALEIAASLLSKDRMDARRLGMESLCLLTDPTKTGMDTALLASQVVLFGNVQEENLDDDAAEFIPDELGIREAILSLVQFGRLGENGDFDSDSEDDVAKGSAEDEFNQILHNLALAVLANALDVLETHGKKIAAESSSDAKPSATTFLEESKEMTNRELLSSLLSVLGNAESKPHDACLSAQCLRSLFQASKKAKRKAKEFNAKQIVMTALDVGRRTHVKLENETQRIIRVLERPDDNDGTTTTTTEQEHDNEESSDDESSREN